MLERFPSVHEQGSCEFTGRPFDAASELGVLLHPEVVPRVQELVSYGVHDHPPPPRQADSLGPSHQIAGMHLLEHSRRPPPLPDLAGWPRSRHPPSHAGPVRARPVLRCSAPWSYRATSLQDGLRTGSDPADVSPAPQRCHKGRIRSLPQERHHIRRVPSQWAFNEWLRRSILPFPYGDVIGENGKIGLGIMLVFDSASCLV